MKLRGVAAGIDDLHPHRFRHTFAHDFLMPGGKERHLKRLAGWSSDAMIERYGASAGDARAKSAAQRLKRGDRRGRPRRGGCAAGAGSGGRHDGDPPAY